MEKLIKFKNLWQKFTFVLIAIFVSYGVIQSTTASLTFKNYWIIAAVFLCCCMEILLCMIINKIYTLPKKGRDSIWKYVKPIDFIVLAFLAINSIWILIIPKMHGFLVSDAISEAGMLITFVVYFPMAILIRLKELDFNKIIKVFYWSTFVLAVIHCIFWSCEALKRGSVETIFNFIGRIPFVRTGEYIVGWGIVRFTISNSILLASGLLLHFREKNPLNVWSIIRIVVFVYAILGTYLKSLWFGVIAGIGVVALYALYLLISKKRKENKKLILNILTVGVSILLATVILSMTAFQGSTLNRFVNSFINTGGVTNFENNIDPEDAQSAFDKEQDKIGAIYSNNIKIEQMHRLYDQWKQSPIIGYGYGSSVPGYYRSETQLFLYEMTIFALLMKIGVVGIVSWALLAVGALVIVIKNNKKKLLNIVLWMAIAGAFLVAIQTNPLLFSANAINLIIFLVLFGVYSSVNNKAETAEELK